MAETEPNDGDGGDETTNLDLQTMILSIQPSILWPLGRIEPMWVLPWMLSLVRE